MIARPAPESGKRSIKNACAGGFVYIETGDIALHTSPYNKTMQEVSRVLITPLQQSVCCYVIFYNVCFCSVLYGDQSVCCNSAMD